MLSDILRQFLTAEPFVPFTLHFTDGHHLEIHDPAMIYCAEGGLLVVRIRVKPYAGSHTLTDHVNYIDPRTIIRIVTSAVPAALVPPEAAPLPPPKPKILFVCTHNSARSQMAEAILRHLAGDRFEAASAGLQVGTVHPLAVRVMQESGLDISHATAKTIFELYQAGHLFSVIVSVCDESREKCPVFPGLRSTLHWSIPEPTAAADPGTMLENFRAARDAIEVHLREWIQQP